MHTSSTDKTMLINHKISSYADVSFYPVCSHVDSTQKVGSIEVRNLMGSLPLYAWKNKDMFLTVFK